jgi:hypothetical protein
MRHIPLVLAALCFIVCAGPLFSFNNKKYAVGLFNAGGRGNKSSS